MERLVSLGEPMTRLAELGGVLNRPWLLVIAALARTRRMGGVTFVAVRLAIVSAARVTRAT